MANIHKALLIDLLKYSRREFIYHSENPKNYQNKKELIAYYGKQCLKYRKLVEACR